ncbi:MAG: hypothetical protein HYT03_00785 [Candidatus Harrisonbacteria bacterium]|nr:hypothetical protein [Candidatus Harrisonbacteria bacterium]
MLIKPVFFLSFTLLALAAVLFYLNFNDAGNFLIVGIDVFRGINFLGSKWDALSILITGGAIFFINLVLALSLKKRSQFIANLISFSTAVISLLILMAIGVIISSN